MNNKRLYLAGLFLLICISQLIAQNIIPASIFGNNMVLQQGIHAPIWGTSNPKEKLTITIAGKTQKIKADGNGKWKTL